MATSACFAVSCARDGTIAQVLRDDFCTAARAGARLRDVVEAACAHDIDAVVTVVARGEFVVGVDCEVKTGDGVRPLRFAGAPSNDALLIFACPSTHEHDHHLYEQLSRLNNDLVNREREVARNAAQLTRVSAEKSRVMAIAAHDLRNPLTIVASYADLLRLDNTLSEEHTAYADEIGRSAKFMMELVEEMLDNARVESGQIELELHDVDLVKAAKHAATINRMRAERKMIAVAFEAQTERAIIRVDPVKLRQIINNLVVNAIKFSPSRTTVTIRVRRNGDRAVIDVADEGIGIARDKIHVIFEPFRTLGSSGTAGETSTGLGLSIVKQLAELHGATVDVESEEGRGSTFSVAFPLAG